MPFPIGPGEILRERSGRTSVVIQSVVRAGFTFTTAPAAPRSAIGAVARVVSRGVDGWSACTLGDRQYVERAFDRLGRRQ